MDKGHGRLEKRTITTTTALNHHVDWPGVKQVCRVVRERTQHGQREIETAYYVSSVSRARANADRLLALIRDHGILEHWGAIENGVHHVRDTTFDEDRCTIFRGHAAQNLAAFRNTALNWHRLMASPDPNRQSRGHHPQLHTTISTTLHQTRPCELGDGPVFSTTWRSEPQQLPCGE